MDRIREGVKKPWAKFVIFAIVISFVGAGYFTSALFLGDPFAAAVVNGESISTQEFQRAYSRTRQQYGEAFDQIVKTPEQEQNFKENILQGLISRSVTLQASQELGMRISTKEIRENIQSIPALQTEGIYSSDLLDQALTRLGLSRAQFKQSMVSDLVLGQLSSGITGTEFVLPSESNEQYKLLGQLRTGRALQIKYSLFDSDVEISEEEIGSYYNANLESFRLAEKISLDYLELSIDELKNDVTPTEDQIQEYYENNLDRFRSEELRRVSHILVTGDDETENLKKAESIKQKLDTGEDFIALVKSESNDDFSVENDGDLGVLAAGDMEEAFDVAMNGLEKVGDISEPVQTSFGYHIIKLTELTEGSTQALGEVQSQIIAALQKSAAEELFYAKSKVLEEKSFEFADSLVEVAELTGLKVKTSSIFSANSATGIFANQEIKDAAFGENVLAAKLNSNLINISENHVVVLRIKSHQPSLIQELDKVKDGVKSNLKSAKAKQAAIAFGDSVKAKLEVKSDIKSLLAGKNIVWKDLDKIGRTGAELPYRQLQEFFNITKPQAELVSIKTMEDFGEYIIFVLNTVEEGEIAKAEQSIIDQSKQRLSGFYANANYASMVEQERLKADVTRNLENINR